MEEKEAIQLLKMACENCRTCRGEANKYDAGYTRCDIQRGCVNFTVIQKAKKELGLSDEEEQALRNGEFWRLDQILIDKKTEEQKSDKSNSLKDILINQLEIAIKDFDFQLAVSFYNVMKWRWFSEDKSPDIEALKTHARTLGVTAIEYFLETGRSAKSSSGGFQICVFEWNSSYEVSIIFAPIYSMSCISKRDI